MPYSIVSPGVVSSGLEITSGGVVQVLSGGMVISPIIHSGGALVLSPGGVASAVTEAFGGVVSGGGVLLGDNYISGSLSGAALGSVGWGAALLEIFGGGAVSDLTLAADSDLLIEDGATASNLVEAAGWPGAKIIDYGSATGVVINSGGEVDVEAGGGVTEVTVSGDAFADHSLREYGYLDLLGVASGVTVLAGGVVDDYGFQFGGVIDSGGLETVLPGALGQGVVVNSGGVLSAWAGAELEDSVVSSGGTLIINPVVSSGQTLAVSSGSGWATVLDGAIIQSGATVDLTGATVLSGAQLDLLSGASMSSVFVSAGGVLVGPGTLYAANTYNEVAGTISGVHVGDVSTIYGQLSILSGGVAENIQVIRGGMFVASGGLASDTVLYPTSTLWPGSELGVAGIAISTDIVSGSIVIVNDGGIASASMISSGGLVSAYSGGVDSGSVALSGGSVIVQQGGETLSSVFSGGDLTVSSGGLASGASLLSGSVLVASDGASLDQITIGAGATLYASGSVSAQGVRVASGGVLEALDARLAGAAVINSGGRAVLALSVSSGQDIDLSRDVNGVERVSNVSALQGAFIDILSANVSSGGRVVLGSGSTVSNLTVSAGGQVDGAGGYVFGVGANAGDVSDLTFLGGGPFSALSGSNLSNVSVGLCTVTLASGAHGVGVTIYSPGGALMVNPGAVNSGAAVEAGTLLVDGRDVGALVTQGGLEFVEGQAIDATITAGGRLSATEGGILSGGNVLSGGVVMIDYLGEAFGVTISSGGAEVVGDSPGNGGAGAVDFGAVLAGGALTLTRSGTASGTRISSGGLELVSGGTAAGAIVSSGGEIVVSSGWITSSVVSGLIGLNGGKLDLATVHGAAAAINANEQLVLTSGGSIVETISLGASEAGVGVQATSDGQGGTLITFVASGATASGTAASLSGVEWDVLASNAGLTAIKVEDNAEVTVDVEELTLDAGAIAKLSFANGQTTSTVQVRDTAAAVVVALAGPLGGAEVAQTIVTDNAAVVVTVAQLTSDAAALTKLAFANGQTTGTVQVRDTAASIGAALATLNGDAQVGAVVIADNAPVTVSLAQLTSLAGVIGRLSNANGAPVALNITDASVDLTAGVPAAAAGDVLNLTAAGAQVSLGAGVGVTLTASGDQVSLANGSVARFAAGTTGSVNVGALNASLTGNSGGASLTGVMSGSAVMAALNGVLSAGALIVSGTGASLSLTSGTVTMGGNGQFAADAGVDSVSFSQSGAVAESANSRLNVTGHGVVVSLAASDNLGLIGTGDTVTVNGAGDAVYAGGDGQAASDANNDTVVFNVAGAVYAADNSRLNVSGHGVTAVLGARDNLGLTATGSTVYVNNTGDGVWLGGNGQGASDANNNAVVFNAAGVAYAFDNSRLNVSGHGATVVLGAQDNLGLTGTGSTVYVNNVGDGVWLGGNGQGASDADNNAVVFNAAGVAYAFDNSRLNVTGAGSTVVLGSHDNLGLTATGSTVYVTGDGDGIWVGGNGQGASDANVDTLLFLNHGIEFSSNSSVVHAFDNSRLNVAANNAVINLGADDNLGVMGSSNRIYVNGAGDQVWAGGVDTLGYDNDADQLYFSSGGVVHALDYSHLNVIGAGVTTVLGASDRIYLNGAGDTAIVNGADDALMLYGNGQGASDADSYKVVFNAAGALTVLSNATLKVSGHGADVSMGDNVDITMAGSGDTITVLDSSDHVVIGGNGQAASDANNNTVLFGENGAVRMTDNARLNFTGRFSTLTLGAQDNLGLTGSGDRVDVNGGGDGVWIGGNGQSADNDHVNTVNFNTAGVAYAADNSRLNVNGHGGSVVLGANDNLGLVGTASTVFVNGAGDGVWIGGDGVWANDANVNTVVFNVAGTAYAFDFSRLNVRGDGSTIVLGAQDNLGLTGSGDTVYVNGTEDGVWIGGNGQGAGVLADVVNFAQVGAATLLANSTVTVAGQGVYITGGDHNSLTLSGLGDHLSMTNSLVAITATAATGPVAAITGAGDVISASILDDVSGLIVSANTGTDTLNWQGASGTQPGSTTIVFSPDASTQTRTIDWSGQNGGGAKLDELDNTSSGGSQFIAYQTVSGFSSLTCTYSGAKASGRLLSAVALSNSGVTSQIQFLYNASGQLTGASDTDLKGGAQLGAASYNASNQMTAHTGTVQALGNVLASAESAGSKVSGEVTAVLAGSAFGQSVALLAQASAAFAVGAAGTGPAATGITATGAAGPAIAAPQ